MKSYDFLKILTDLGIKNTPRNHSMLTDFLSVGKSFEDVLMMRKIERSVEEFQTNTFLKSIGTRKRRDNAPSNQLSFVSDSSSM
jgi:hypothetical protein